MGRHRRVGGHRGRTDTPGSGLVIREMPFYLFKSTCDDLVRAITTDPDGTGLPRSLAPWEHHRAADELMEHVLAVSDQIQSALDIRGYYLIRLSSLA